MATPMDPTDLQYSGSLIAASLELVAPLTTAAGTTSHRDVVFVRIESADGVVGWGEAAPLPGWPGPDLAAVTSDLRRWIGGGLTGTPAVGPARAAVDSALLDIAAQESGVSIATYLNADAGGAVAVNQLIDALDPEDVELAALNAVAEGFGTIKLKVATTGHDVERVAAVRRAAPDARLRLDANRGFDHDAAVAFCRAVEPFDIEFIEEPVAGGIDALVAVQADVGIVVAADESLAEIEVADYAQLPVELLVIKPSALGHLEALYSLASKRPVVFTSFLESAVGVTLTLHLAAAAQSGTVLACGLATSGRFGTDVAPAPSLRHGLLQVPTIPGLGVVPVVTD